jgi:hypothetical protein
MKKKYLAIFIIPLILLSGCSGSEANFDSFFSIYGYLDQETSKQFILPVIQSENSDLTEIASRNVEYNEINMIFDVSAGLVDGFIAAEKTIIKPLYEAFEKRNLFKCGFEKAETCVQHSGNIDYFKKRDTYNFPFSFIQGGLNRATENPNEISVFFTDYLYDDGSNSYPATNKVNTSNILTRGWELPAFKDWFSAGGRVYIQVIPYMHERWQQETNYYAIYFVPRNANFENNERIQRLFAEIEPLVIDPLNIIFDASNFSEAIAGNNSIYEGESKVFDVDEDRAFAFLGLKFNESKANNLSNLGRINIVNNSVWKIDWEIRHANVTSIFRDELGSSMLGWSSDDSKHQFTEWQFPSGDVMFNDQSSAGFNPLPYVERPDVFFVKHEAIIKNVSSNIIESDFKTRLTCLVRPDNQREFYTNEALFIDIDQAIENSRSDILKFLQEKPLFRLYSFTSVGKY